MTSMRMLAIIAVLGASAAAPAAAQSPTSICWNDGSNTVVTCAHGGSWDPDPSAWGTGQCWHVIAFYDLGSGQHSTGWQSAGAAVELGGQVVHIC